MRNTVAWANLTSAPSGILIGQYDDKEHYTSVQANNTRAAIFRTTGTIAYALFVRLPDQQSLRFHKHT